MFPRITTATCLLALGLLGSATPALSQDKVKMALFIASSAAPYFIANERGYFKEENLEVEGIPIANHPLIVQALAAYKDEVESGVFPADEQAY